MEKRERGKSRSEGQERAAFSSAASPEFDYYYFLEL